MNGLLRAATLLVSVLLVAVAPAEAAKPKAKACKKGTVKVKTGKTTRCVKLRVAPPAPKAHDPGRQVVGLVLSSRWPALKDRRGRVVRSPAKELARVKGATAKLRAAMAKGLRLAAAKAGTAAASRAATASRAAEGGGAAASGRAVAAGAAQAWPFAGAAQAGGGGSVTGVAEGDAIGFDAEVPAGAYRISVQFRTNDMNGFVKGERCPTAAGLLKGDVDAKTTISIALIAGTRTVMSSSTEMLDRAHYEAHTGDDAKMDTLDVEHTGTLSAHLAGAGHGAVSFRLRAHRTAQANMRAGGYTSSNRQLDVAADIQGAPPGAAAALQAQLASQLSAGTDEAFARVVGRGTGNYRFVEAEIQQDGRCATLSFDPRAEPPEKKYKKGETGTFTAFMRPKVEPNGRASGRFTVVAKNYVSLDPETGQGTNPSFTFKVIQDTDKNGYATLRATSKAGVATGARDIPIEVGSPRYKVTALTYTDQLQFDHLMPVSGCTPSSSQGNTATLVASGQPEDGFLSAPIPEPIGHGEQTGQIVAKGNIQKQVAYTGCQVNGDGTAYVPCQQQNSGNEDFYLTIDLFVDTGFGDAKLTWHPRAASLGDVVPIISPCVVFGGQALGPISAVTTVPREALFDAGPHTFSVDVPFEGPAATGTLHSNAHYSVTIERL